MTGTTAQRGPSNRGGESIGQQRRTTRAPVRGRPSLQRGQTLAGVPALRFCFRRRRGTGKRGAVICGRGIAPSAPPATGGARRRCRNDSIDHAPARREPLARGPPRTNPWPRKRAPRILRLLRADRVSVTLGLLATVSVPYKRSSLKTRCVCGRASRTLKALHTYA